MEGLQTELKVWQKRETHMIEANLTEEGNSLNIRELKYSAT
jgi:hypothetical protein